MIGTQGRCGLAGSDGGRANAEPGVHAMVACAAVAKAGVLTVSTGVEHKVAIGLAATVIAMGGATLTASATQCGRGQYGGGQSGGKLSGGGGSSVAKVSGGGIDTGNGLRGRVYFMGGRYRHDHWRGRYGNRQYR
jgi:hypothetical protein